MIIFTNWGYYRKVPNFSKSTRLSEMNVSKCCKKICHNPVYFPCLKGKSSRQATKGKSSSKAYHNVVLSSEFKVALKVSRAQNKSVMLKLLPKNEQICFSILKSRCILGMNDLHCTSSNSEKPNSPLQFNAHFAKIHGLN